MAKPTTIVHVRVSAGVKQGAQKVAKELGVSLSLVAEQALRNFSATRRLVIEETPAPTRFLEKILHEVDRDVRRGNKKAFSPVFDSAADMHEYLDEYVRACK